MTPSAEVAFIGGGHMARCLVQGLVAQGRDPARIVVANPNGDTCRMLAAELHVQVTADNAEAAAAAPVWVLAVKPQVAAAVCQALAPVAVQVRPLVVSIMAGITHAQLRQWLGTGNVVRSMPNQPAAIGAGVTGLYAAPSLDATQRASAEAVFRGAGTIVWLHDEAQMDTVTAVAGSGPAYLYLLAEAMEQAARARDLPAETARHLVVQTLLGAARMLQAADEAPTRLRERVTSPGGTTQAAVQVLEEGGWMALVDRAVDAARARGQALAG
ncbi:Pyrroline-5-carboxylate reductase [uncultured Stenotrophomonas sp.]|uniref:Pyrroline-5-carboxylate reductase n=1 Tax=uncultured Stenotrophomonas sp. TaxID=165438 RepID=A0A1Y5Q6W6_9GAMM|nr:Pyrroline-5-carboxylate reductase [uncultured Stenotrophomonas sp.]